MWGERQTTRDEVNRPRVVRDAPLPAPRSAGLTLQLPSTRVHPCGPSTRANSSLCRRPPRRPDFISSSPQTPPHNSDHGLPCSRRVSEDSEWYSSSALTPHRRVRRGRTPLERASSASGGTGPPFPLGHVDAPWVQCAPCTTPRDAHQLIPSSERAQSKSSPSSASTLSTATRRSSTPTRAGLRTFTS